MKVPLSRGLYAIVDDSDYDFVKQWKWSASLVGGRRFYAVRMAAGKMISLHRLIAETPPGMHTDHINGDTLDNRRCNLRCVTQAQNNMNLAKRTGTISRFKGVTFDRARGMWRASLTASGRTFNLGRFHTEEAAAQAYAQRAALEFGKYNRSL